MAPRRSNEPARGQSNNEEEQSGRAEAEIQRIIRSQRQLPLPSVNTFNHAVPRYPFSTDQRDGDNMPLPGTGRVPLDRDGQPLQPTQQQLPQYRNDHHNIPGLLQPYPHHGQASYGAATSYRPRAAYPSLATVDHTAGYDHARQHQHFAPQTSSYHPAQDYIVPQHVYNHHPSSYFASNPAAAHYARNQDFADSYHGMRQQNNSFPEAWTRGLPQPEHSLNPTAPDFVSSYPPMRNSGNGINVEQRHDRQLGVGEMGNTGHRGRNSPNWGSFSDPASENSRYLNDEPEGAGENDSDGGINPHDFQRSLLTLPVDQCDDAAQSSKKKRSQGKSKAKPRQAPQTVRGPLPTQEEIDAMPSSDEEREKFGKKKFKKVKNPTKSTIRPNMGTNTTADRMKNDNRVHLRWDAKKGEAVEARGTAEHINWNQPRDQEILERLGAFGRPGDQDKYSIRNDLRDVIMRRQGMDPDNKQNRASAKNQESKAFKAAVDRFNGHVDQDGAERIKKTRQRDGNTQPSWNIYGRFRGNASREWLRLHDTTADAGFFRPENEECPPLTETSTSIMKPRGYLAGVRAKAKGTRRRSSGVTGQDAADDEGEETEVPQSKKKSQSSKASKKSSKKRDRQAYESGQEDFEEAPRAKRANTRSGGLRTSAGPRYYQDDLLESGDRADHFTPGQDANAATSEDSADNANLFDSTNAGLLDQVWRPASNYPMPRAPTFAMPPLRNDNDWLNFRSASTESSYRPQSGPEGNLGNSLLEDFVGEPGSLPEGVRMLGGLPRVRTDVQDGERLAAHTPALTRANTELPTLVNGSPVTPTHRFSDRFFENYDPNEYEIDFTEADGVKEDVADDAEGDAEDE